MIVMLTVKPQSSLSVQQRASCNGGSLGGQSAELLLLRGTCLPVCLTLG